MNSEKTAVSLLAASVWMGAVVTLPASEFYKSINQLANNNVTLATEYFKSGDKVTRGRFALFLARSAKWKP